MLLTDLVRHTPSEHPDSENLAKALSKIETVASYVNEQQRRFSQIARVPEIDKYFRKEYLELQNGIQVRFNTQRLISSIDSLAPTLTRHRRHHSRHWCARTVPSSMRDCFARIPPTRSATATCSTTYWYAGHDDGQHRHAYQPHALSLLDLRCVAGCQEPQEPPEEPRAHSRGARSEPHYRCRSYVPLTLDMHTSSLLT